MPAGAAPRPSRCWSSSCASHAAAQRRRQRPRGLFHGPLSVGPRVGRDFENHAWSLGGQVSLPVGRKLELRPSGDFFFPKHGDTGWQANGDAAIHLGQGGGLYAGGGIAFAHPGGGKTKTGYNLFFGLSTAAPTSSSSRSSSFAGPSSTTPARSAWRSASTTGCGG